MVKNNTKLNDEIVGYQQYLYDSIEKGKNDYKLSQNIYLNSMFITKNAQEIVSKLVTIFEGETYSCLDINYTSKYEAPERLLLVTKGKYDEPPHVEWTGGFDWDYSKNWDPVKDKVKEGNSFVLARNRYTFTGGVIDIYSPYLYSDIDYGRFTYVKEFFDYVIGYRLKNEKLKKEIHEELPELLKNFAKNNRELIEKNYHKKNVERVKEYKMFLRKQKQEIKNEIDSVLESKENEE